MLICELSPDNCPKLYKLAVVRYEELVYRQHLEMRHLHSNEQDGGIRAVVSCYFPSSANKASYSSHVTRLTLSKTQLYSSGGVPQYAVSANTVKGVRCICPMIRKPDPVQVGGHDAIATPAGPAALAPVVAAAASGGSSSSRAPPATNSRCTMSPFFAASSMGAT